MNPFAELPSHHYHTIYADPPWMETGAGVKGGRRGADKHYALMRTTDIAALPVPELAASNSHLYLWTTNRFFPDALKVMEAWGFEYRTKITWMKDRFGLGQYFRGITEDCLFGVRGVLPYKTRPDGKRAQGVTGFVAPRTEHSVKPDEMRRMIELVSYGPRIELFGRTSAPGWDVWGDETSKSPAQMTLDRTLDDVTEEVLMQLVGACPDDGEPLRPQAVEGDGPQSILFGACRCCGIEWERRFADGVMCIYSEEQGE